MERTSSSSGNGKGVHVSRRRYPISRVRRAAATSNSGQSNSATMSAIRAALLPQLPVELLQLGDRNERNESQKEKKEEEEERNRAKQDCDIDARWPIEPPRRREEVLA